MTTSPSLGNVRAYLEHRPWRRVFQVDESACAEAFVAIVGQWYDIRGRDRDGTWVAVRRDDRRRVTGRTPDELRSAVMADFAASPVWPR